MESKPSIKTSENSNLHELMQERRLDQLQDIFNPLGMETMLGFHSELEEKNPAYKPAYKKAETSQEKDTREYQESQSGYNVAITGFQGAQDYNKSEKKRREQEKDQAINIIKSQNIINSQAPILNTPIHTTETEQCYYISEDNSEHLAYNNKRLSDMPEGLEKDRLKKALEAQSESVAERGARLNTEKSILEKIAHEKGYDFTVGSLCDENGKLTDQAREELKGLGLSEEKITYLSGMVREAGLNTTMQELIDFKNTWLKYNTPEMQPLFNKYDTGAPFNELIKSTPKDLVESWWATAKNNNAFQNPKIREAIEQKLNETDQEVDNNADENQDAPAMEPDEELDKFAKYKSEIAGIIASTNNTLSNQQLENVLKEFDISLTMMDYIKQSLMDLDPNFKFQENEPQISEGNTLQLNNNILAPAPVASS